MTNRFTHDEQTGMGTTPSFGEVLRATDIPGTPSEEALRRFASNILREPNPDNPDETLLSADEQRRLEHDPAKLAGLWQMATRANAALSTMEAADRSPN